VSQKYRDKELRKLTEQNETLGQQIAFCERLITNLKDALPDPEITEVPGQLQEFASLADDLGWKRCAGLLSAAVAMAAKEAATA
jgi:hypothetical protein